MTVTGLVEGPGPAQPPAPQEAKIAAAKNRFGGMDLLPRVH